MQHFDRFGERPDHRNLFDFGAQRKRAIIFQQHDRLLRRLERERPVRLAVDLRIGRLRIRHHLETMASPSETSYPLNFHAPRNWSLSKNVLAQAGSPLTRL